MKLSATERTSPTNYSQTALPKSIAIPLANWIPRKSKPWRSSKKLPLQIVFEFEKMLRIKEDRRVRRSLLLRWWMCLVEILCRYERLIPKKRRGCILRMLRLRGWRIRIEVVSLWDLKRKTTSEKLSSEKTSKSKSNTSETSQYLPVLLKPEKWYLPTSSSRKKWFKQRC